MNKQTKTSTVIPGEQVAEIEEFESGKNTFVSGGAVRSSVMGNKQYDLKRRIVRIDQKKSLIMNLSRMVLPILLLTLTCQLKL